MLFLGIFLKILKIFDPRAHNKKILFYPNQPRINWLLSLQDRLIWNQILKI